MASPLTLDDWKPRLAELDSRLKEWNARFLSELETVKKEHRIVGFLRRPRPEELQAAAYEARRRAGVGILAETTGFLDALCDLYPTLLPQFRAEIRARVGSAEGLFDVLWAYVEAMPDRIRGEDAERNLARAFVAVAIDDMRAELSLIDGVMGRIVLAAAREGLDRKEPLAAAAAVANLGAGGGGACTREYLASFEASKHFREAVAPGLAEVRRGAGGTQDGKRRSA